MTGENVIDSFVIAEVAPIFLRDLAGNRGHLEGYAGKREAYPAG